MAHPDHRPDRHPRPARRPRPARAFAGVVVAVLFVAGCSGDDLERAATTTSTTSTTTTTEDRDGTADTFDTFDEIPSIVEEVQPSVVTISANGGVGSGVIVEAGGIVVTNAHVVQDLDEVTVTFADGVRSPGTVVGREPLLDLAVVETDRTGLPAATFAENLPRVGELAVAIGSPLGLEQTITAGIVSGINRSVPGSARITQSLVNLIQTDAPISPGNSGGALVNGDGEVVGVNVAYIPPSAGGVSLGFAIPAPQVTDAVDELRTQGSVSLAYIGIVPARVTPQLVERFDLARDRGVLVAELAGEGPAEDAGIEPGDLFVSFDGEPIDSVEAFLGLLRRRDPGDTVTVELVRDGEQRTVEVELAERPRN